MLIGDTLGPYRIVGKMGEGGMGQVFRARDTKLDRDVAIKVLPEAFARDADRLARFTREAKTLASLNHPNIAAIYGLEENVSSTPSTPSTRSGQAGSGQAGITALVMELVEGEDLSERISAAHRRSPTAHGLPLDEALPIAKQIAEALEAAHEQGIVHRDLKPANIKVRQDGTVKVLDFGLAKAMDPLAASSPEAMNSPTITTPVMTQAGMILGTAAYMSPEQARGKVVDKRADIWAFGAVLFEMLTGATAFAGDDVADVMSRVLQREPDLATLPPATPARVRSLVARCLVKDPRQRVRDMGDVRLALDGAFETSVSPVTTSGSSAAPGVRLPWIAFAVAAALAAALAIPAVRHLLQAPPPVLPETRLDIVTPPTIAPTDFALSPDGRQIVYVASADGAERLWLRSLTTTTAQPLPGTEDGTAPFWAPDGRSIGFSTPTALKRLDLGGGTPQTLASVGAVRGGTWNAAGVIVFAATRTGPLMRVSAAGGTTAAVTTLAPRQSGHLAPFFLPDGHRFLFYAAGAPDTAGVYLGALDGSAPTRLTPADSAGVFLQSLPSPADPTSLAGRAASGWLLWVRDGGLVAQRLDVATATLTGEPLRLADGLAVDRGVGFRSAASVAFTGLVAYRTGGSSQRQLTWVDRSGATRGTVGDPDDTLLNPRVSPDGRRVVVSRVLEGNEDLWLLDGTRASRFTFDPAVDRFPTWSPDGARIVFRSNRTGAGDLYLKLTSGAAIEERLAASTPNQTNTPSGWSTDGRFLLSHVNDPRTNLDLWVVPMLGERTPAAIVKTPFREGWGAFSPDGRWVAYYSNESGRNEVYVRPFIPPGTLRLRSGQAAEAAASGQWQVSTAGGIYPAWRPDGKELYYLNPAGDMMAAPITASRTALAPGAPVVLFPTHVHGGGSDSQQGRQYDVAPDGRFLINTVLDSAAAPITLLMNWNPEAKQ